MMPRFARSPVLLLISASVAATARADTLSLQDAVTRALESYPGIRASAEDLAAAGAALNLARTTYLPRVEVLGQFNRATRNNVYGLLLSQPFFSPISGPVQANDVSSAWGSLVGVLVAWEPFDFGWRGATVDQAEWEQKRAEASTTLSRLDVAAQTADAFMTALAAERTVVAARAAVDRARVLEDVVGALVRADVRPGVDAARAHAERALAETQLIRAEQALRKSRAVLAELSGTTESGMTLDAGPLFTPPELGPERAASLESHPLAQQQEAALETARARELAAARSYAPHFNLLATSYARGTDGGPSTPPEGGSAGLAPDVTNWGLGFQFSFSALDFVAFRARKSQATHLRLAEQARYDRVVVGLERQHATAIATLEEARRVAEQVPVQLEAARAVREQANARYRAGLATIVEVADAERLLTQAEIDSALAELAVWRALLGLGVAEGDLKALLDRSAGR